MSGGLELLQQPPGLGALAEGPPKHRQRMSRLEGSKTTAAVKYRQFEPSCWERAAWRTMTRPGSWGAGITPDTDIPTWGEGRSGIFPRFSPTSTSASDRVPHTRALGPLSRGRPGCARLCHRHHAVDNGRSSPPSPGVRGLENGPASLPILPPWATPRPFSLPPLLLPLLSLQRGIVLAASTWVTR